MKLGPEEITLCFTKGVEQIYVTWTLRGTITGDRWQPLLLPTTLKVRRMWHLTSKLTKPPFAFTPFSPDLCYFSNVYFFPSLGVPVPVWLCYFLCGVPFLSLQKVCIHAASLSPSVYFFFLFLTFFSFPSLLIIQKWNFCYLLTVYLLFLIFKASK